MEYYTTKPASDMSAMYIINATNNETNLLKPPYWSIAEQVCLSIVLIPIILISICGNAMVVIAVAYFKDMQRKTYVLIANLAVADFGVSLLCMPVSLITVIKGDWVFGDTFCAINGFLEALFLFASIHGLLYISVHKYFQIAKPLRRVVDKKWATVMIALTWIVAFTVAMAPVVGLTVNEYKPGTSQCGPKFPEGVTGTIHAGYSVLMGFIIPWTVMVVCYTIIFRKITKHGQRMSRNSSMGQRRVFVQQKRITITLFVVFILFFICWAPFIIFNIFGFAKGFDNIPIWPNAYVYWMGYLNSAINPVIYGWRNRSFKKAFREIRHCCQTSSTFITEDGVVTTNPRHSRRTKRILYPPVIPSSPSPNKLPTNQPRFNFERHVSHISLNAESRRIRFGDENGGPLEDSPTGPTLHMVLEEDSSIADSHIAAHSNPAFDGIADDLTDIDTYVQTNTLETSCVHSDVGNGVGMHNEGVKTTDKTTEITAEMEHLPNADEGSQTITTNRTNVPCDVEKVPDVQCDVEKVPDVQCDVEKTSDNLESKMFSNRQNKQVLELPADTNRRKTSLTKISENLMSALSTVTASSTEDIDNEILLSSDEIDSL